MKECLSLISNYYCDNSGLNYEFFHLVWLFIWWGLFHCDRDRSQNQAYLMTYTPFREAGTMWTLPSLFSLFSSFPVLLSPPSRNLNTISPRWRGAATSNLSSDLTFFSKYFPSSTFWRWQTNSISKYACNIWYGLACLSSTYRVWGKVKKIMAKIVIIDLFEYMKKVL